MGGAAAVEPAPPALRRSGEDFMLQGSTSAAVPVGTVLPLRPEIVKSTSTTATYILALGD